MEEYSSNVRFVLTANSIDRIVEPIQSRCCLFNLQPNTNDIIKRCVHILKSENITVSEDQKPKLLRHIEYCYPDLRRIINDIQKFSISGNLLISENNELKDFTKQIFDLLISKTNSLIIRKKIIEEEKRFNADYQLLLSQLFDLFYNDQNQNDMTKKNILMDIGEYMYRDVSVLDKEINFFCCIISLEKILKS